MFLINIKISLTNKTRTFCLYKFCIYEIIKAEMLIKSSNWVYFYDLTFLC